MDPTNDHISLKLNFLIQIFGDISNLINHLLKLISKNEKEYCFKIEPHFSRLSIMPMFKNVSFDIADISQKIWFPCYPTKMKFYIPSDVSSVYVAIKLKNSLYFCISYVFLSTCWFLIKNLPCFLTKLKF